MQKEAIIIVLTLLVLLVVGQEIISYTTRKISDYIQHGVLAATEASSNTYEDFQVQAVFAKKTQALTVIMGVIEATSFFVLILCMAKGLIILELLSVATIMFGWIALKGIGNFGTWGNSIFGRGMFYKFLFGTFMNITFAVLLGLLAAYLVK